MSKATSANRITAILRNLLHQESFNASSIPETVKPLGELHWSYDGRQVVVLLRYPKGYEPHGELEATTRQVRAKLEEEGFSLFSRESSGVWREAKDQTAFMDAQYILEVQ